MGEDKVERLVEGYIFYDIIEAVEGFLMLNHLPDVATMNGRSIDVVGPQIWNRPPRLPTLIQLDFTPPSKPSSDSFI